MWHRPSEDDCGAEAEVVSNLNPISLGRNLSWSRDRAMSAVRSTNGAAQASPVHRTGIKGKRIGDLKGRPKFGKESFMTRDDFDSSTVRRWFVGFREPKLDRPFRSPITLSINPGRRPGLAWGAPLVLRAGWCGESVDSLWSWIEALSVVRSTKGAAPSQPGASHRERGEKGLET